MNSYPGALNVPIYGSQSQTKDTSGLNEALIRNTPRLMSSKSEDLQCNGYKKLVCRSAKCSVTIPSLIMFIGVYRERLSEGVSTMVYSYVHLIKSVVLSLVIYFSLVLEILPPKILPKNHKTFSFL